jgi:hypothetical protein
MPTLQDLANIVQRQMAEIDRQRKIIAKQQMEIEHLVAWASSDLDALMILQAIYRNPNTPEGNRIKTALGALPFERPKPASTINNVVNFSLFKHLEEAKTIEHRRAVEHQPEPNDAPTPATILGDGPDVA